jgi:murein L,D-transpeptidase YcbB/YkuD
MLRLVRLLVTMVVVSGLAALAPGAMAAGNESTGDAIKEFITSGKLELAGQDDDERLFQIFTFYEGRSFKPIWTRDNGVKAKARVLLVALEKAGEHGLDPAYYAVEEIKARIDSQNPEELAELDLLLSMVFVEFAQDLSKGRVEPSRVDSSVHIRPTAPGPLYVIDGAEMADDLGPYIESLAPTSPRYHRLKEALARYRQIAADGGWPSLPEGPVLKPGMEDERIPVLRRRLAAEGDLAEGSDLESKAYDEALKAAVAHFQERHGLEPDGVIGADTLAQLNETVEERIEQIVLNLERRRWLSDELGERFVFVNLADQYLKVVQMVGDREKTIHTARLVVGKPYHATPVFTELMRYVVFNPYWNVPPSIANNEYLPMLKRDPGALARQNIRVFAASGEISPYSVDWNSLSRVPYSLRQDSGEKNALGRIKFMFPNQFNVYIHDTPSKSLFAKDSRVFSHGCMRVQYPEQLAEVLLGPQGWTMEKIKAQIASGEQRIVNLESKVPVYVTYLTAWVNKDGTVNFRRDVYGRDKKLAAALLKK